MTDHTRDIEFEAGDLGYIQASALFETDDEGVTYFARINANGFEISREILVQMTSAAEVEKWEDWAAEEFSREAEDAACDAADHRYQLRKEQWL